jgi:hypothetical protein
MYFLVASYIFIAGFLSIIFMLRNQNLIEGSGSDARALGLIVFFIISAIVWPLAFVWLILFGIAKHYRLT